VDWAAATALLTDGAEGAEGPSPADRKIAFFDELLDQWELAAKAEDEDVYMPADWEDEALAFVTEWISTPT
jgi:hypothetical protein